MQDAGWEIASHGLRWIDYRNHTPEAERADLEEAIRLHTEVTGEAPRGWYTGRTSVQTVDLVSETGLFDWIADTYDDDLPYWREHAGRQQLIIPYSLESNDMRFSAGTFHTAEDYLHLPPRHLRRPLRRGRGRPPEDDVRRPALPPRRPPRPHQGPRRLHRPRPGPRQRLDRHPRRHRRPLARPPPGARRRADAPDDALQATTSSPASAAIYEHSPWIAERAHALELGPAHDTAVGLANALARAFRSASEDERLGVLTAHPDLAGKLAAAKRLTAGDRPPSRPAPASTP